MFTLNQISKTEDSNFLTINRKNLDELTTLIEELVINKVRLEKMKDEILNTDYSKILEQQIRIVSQLQTTTINLNTLQMDILYKQLSEYLHKLNSKKRKQFELYFSNPQVELDNSILSELTSLLKDLLEYIIDSDNNNQENSKRINVDAMSNKQNIVITLTCNNIFFNYENICKVMERQSIDIFNLNETELSTFFNISNIYFDNNKFIKLKSKLLTLGGNLFLNSSKENFLQLDISIPISSTITSSLLVKVSGETYAVPLQFIETIINRNSLKIKKSNNKEIIIYMDKVLPLIRIADKLNFSNKNEGQCILIVNINNYLYGLLVDSLIEQADIVIRPNPSIMNSNLEYKGTTILGDGMVTLVLNIENLVK